MFDGPARAVRRVSTINGFWRSQAPRLGPCSTRGDVERRDDDIGAIAADMASGFPDGWPGPAELQALLVQPGQAGLGHFGPSAVDGQRVATILELDQVGLRRGVPVLLERRLGDRLGDGVVLATHGEQERTSVGVVGVHLVRGMGREARGRSLEQRPPGRGDRPLLVELVDSSSGMALPKLKRNCLAVRDTALCLLAGFLNTGSVECNAESGSRSTPLIWAASMPMAAAPLFMPNSFSAIMPPKECPMRIGGAGRRR